ncbi:MAG: hypothetical protein ACK43N_00415, partial [Pirellulaceae bacterium]
MARNRMARNKLAKGKSAGDKGANSRPGGFQEAPGMNKPMHASNARRPLHQRETKIFAQVADESQTLAGGIDQEDAWLLLAALSADPESLEEVEAAVAH